MELLKVYLADNGDIFLEYKNDYKEHSKEEVDSLIEQAKKQYESGNFQKCKYIQKGIFGSYIDENNNFIGNEQIHILTEYNCRQDCIYINYNGNKKPFWD